MFRGFLKLSTQVDVTVLMIDSTDHITGKTGLAAGITKYLSKNGTAASATMTTAEVDATNVKGVYKLTFTTTHTDTLGEFQLHLTATGADPSDDWWSVVTYLPGEAAILQTGTGTGQLDFTSGVVKANATQWVGGAIPAVSVTGVPLVDLKYTLGTISPAAAGSVRADAVTGAVGSVTGSAGSVTGAVGSVTGNVGGNVVGSVGSVVGLTASNLDATVSSRLAPTVAARTLDVSATGEAGIDWANIGAPTTAVALTGTTISTAQVVASVTGAVGSVTGAVGSVTGNVGGNVVGSVGSVTGAVGSVTGAVGSVTGNVGGNVVGSVGSVAAGGITATSFAAGAFAAVWTVATRTLTSSLDPTAATIAAAVWDEAIAGHLTAGSTGAKLNAAASAGDPWVTPLPGAYGAGTAGFIVGTNLDATVSSRLASAGYTVPPTAIQNADAYLDRANAIETGVTPRQADRLQLSALAGKVSGAATATNVFRNAVVDDKNRITATVDADGNRTAITYDVT